MKRKQLFLLLLSVVFLMPHAVFAHATPIEFEPNSVSGLAEAPREARITFSERIEAGASRIVVENENGQQITTEDAQVDPSDAHVLSVPIPKAGDGTYTVVWSVISSDDGHFTRGSFAYVVGLGKVGVDSSGGQVEIVQLSAIPEALAIFVELLGNSFLWGALIIFLLCIRPLRTSISEIEKRELQVAFLVCVAVGVFLVILGGGIHIALKVSELSGLNQINFKEALSLYAKTTSGFATIVRVCAACIFAGIFFLRRKSIFASPRITVSEVLLIVLLCVFAYFRAKVSHATANPFFPEVSVAINFLHLIGKALWEGLLGVLVMLLLSKKLRPLFHTVVSKVFVLLAVAFGVASSTATYIVWLHLKDFSNLTGTLWGERFIPLLVVGFFATALLAYHVGMRKWLYSATHRYFAATLAAEWALGMLILFFSSLMIITSPPIEVPHTGVRSAVSEGVNMTLTRSPYEDDKILLVISPVTDDSSVPVVMIGSGEDGLLVGLEKRFNGGYVFPLALLPQTETEISVTETQKGAYDAHAIFTLRKGDLESAPSNNGGRTFDFFTICMIALGLGSIVFSVFLYRLSGGVYPKIESKYVGFQVSMGFICALIIASQCIHFGTWLFANDFKRTCEADGNGWHIMQPTREGRATSAIPQEGCMTLMGAYFFADSREYAYAARVEDAVVSMQTTPQVIEAGKKTRLTFTLKDETGGPSELYLEHERLLHVVIVSADTNSFAHIHPEDFPAENTENSKMSSSFSVDYTFPKAGKYLVSIDYSHKLRHESKQFEVLVSGAPAQEARATTYPEDGTFDGFSVSLRHGPLTVGYPGTLSYEITKNGLPVKNLVPYLGAPMHVAVVKSDLSAFVHTHGEVHKPGDPIPPIVVKDGKIVHSMASMYMPAQFGPMIESHVLFPSPGDYTVFGQFKEGERVVVTKFTVRVD